MNHTGEIPSARGILRPSSPKNRTIVWTLAIFILSVCLSNSVAQVERTVSRSPLVSPQNPTVRQNAPIRPGSQSASGTSDSKVDLSGLGGSIYSTGLEDVWVRLISQKHHSLDGDVPYFSHVYLLRATNGQTYLGSNYEDKFLNLGRLPAGEIRIKVHNTVENISVETGPAARNPDGLAHATVREIPGGGVEARFEHSPGLTEARLMSGTYVERLRAHNHFFHDSILQFTGGVTKDPAVGVLLTMLKDEDAQKRKAAEAALRQVHPNIARSAGIR